MLEKPDEYQYFLDIDESGNVNVFAAVTNYGLYGSNTDGYGLDKGPGELFRDPNARYLRGGTELEGFGAVFHRDNSGVNWTGAAREYLGPRVPESVARRLHPRLFERIDN
mgnify:CR=1 FL=1